MHCVGSDLARLVLGALGVEVAARGLRDVLHAQRHLRTPLQPSEHDQKAFFQMLQGHSKMPV